MNPRPIAADVLRVGEVADASVVGLTHRFGVELRQFAAGEMLPGIPTPTDPRSPNSPSTAATRSTIAAIVPP